MTSALAAVIAGLFLAAIIYMFKKGVNIGLVMLFASLGVVILKGVTPSDALEYAANGIVSYKTIKLLILIYLIMILESVMRRAGMIDSMVSSLRNILGNRRLAAALLPLVIGLLPSPGGARFSCPMVRDVTGDSTDDSNKAFVNYWYRHIWMDAFLLYPGIILASELANISLLKLFIVIVPFMLFLAVLGWFFGLKKISMEGSDIVSERRKNLKIFLKSLAPVIATVTMYIVLSMVFDYALEVSLTVVLIFLFISNRYTLKEVSDAVRKAFPAKYILIILGVMIFRQVIFDSGAVDSISRMAAAYDIPVKLLYMVLPFIGGFASGIAVTGVSIAFPVLIPLGMGQNILHIAIAFAAGFVGVMTTPLHLCAVMTADYFNITTGKLLSKTIVAELIFIAVLTLILFLF